MIYTVKKIEEDLDFGCEERADGVSAMAVVTLEDLDLQESRIKMEDDLLYARSIQEGDKVYLDEENKLDKALDEDWTRKCMVRTMDTAAFVDRLQAVKAGRSVAALKGDFELVLSNCVYIHCQPIFQSFP